MYLRVGIEPAEGIRGPDLQGERWSGRNQPTRTAIVLSPDGRQLEHSASTSAVRRIASLTGFSSVPDVVADLVTISRRRSGLSTAV